MKKLAIVVSVATVLTACGTTGNNYSSQFSNQNTLQSAQMSNAISQAPEWMSKLPKAAGYVFENGTATSSDFGFADIKARPLPTAKSVQAQVVRFVAKLKCIKLTMAIPALSKVKWQFVPCVLT